MKKVLLVLSLLTLSTNIFGNEPLNTDKIIDKIVTYPNQKYNVEEKLDLRTQLSDSKKKEIQENIFKNLSFLDKDAFEKDENGNIENYLNKEYRDYLYYLLEVLRKGNFLETEYSKNYQEVEGDRIHYGEIVDTEINFNDFHRRESIERFIKRATGLPSELNIELVQQDKKGMGNNYCLYHLILSDKKLNNRVVAVIPYLIDIKNKTFNRIDKDFVFITPMKVYNGIAEFFNTFVIKRDRYYYRSETGRFGEEKIDKGVQSIIFNNRTLDIADTRKPRRYSSYIESLLNDKMDNIRKRRLRTKENENRQLNEDGETYISEDEYENLLSKAKRVLHNYQYVEEKPLTLSKSVLKDNSYVYSVYYNEKDREKIIRPKDYMFTYDIWKYNLDEKLNLTSAGLFKEIALDDKKVYKTDINGFLIDELKDEYNNYLKNLLRNLSEAKIVDSEVSINSIEDMIQKITGKATQKSIELISVDNGKYHYHITVDTVNYENRNVLVIPFTVDTVNRVIVRHNQNLIFVSPWNVYNGVSEFFNTYLKENRTDYNEYKKVLTEDNFSRPYLQERDRFAQKTYRDYLNERERGYISSDNSEKKYLTDEKDIVEQYRKYTDRLEKDLRKISNIGLDARKESSVRPDHY